MDHVPQPAQCSAPPLQVPHIAETTYDFSGFETFPQRQGFVRDGHLDATRPSIELASLMQSWLYFGLLSEILGRPVHSDDFVQSMPPDHAYPEVLCSSKLPLLFDEWQVRLRGLGVDKCDEELRSMTGTLKIAIEGSELFDEIETPGYTPYAVVALSVKILIITLIHLHNSVNPEAYFSASHPGLIPVATNWHGRHPPPAKLLTARMVEAGWCPRAIRRVCTSHNYSTVLYLSQLKRLRTEGHGDCTVDLCLAYNVRETHYSTKHVSADCNCEHVFVDVQKVKSIILSGGIPLVQAKSNGTGVLRLIVTNSATQPYYAISHVWVDGLSNPNANSMPTCQLRYLSARLPQAKRFWIDTLCIPVADADAPVRRKAIDSMASIYHGARAVIVLDAEIQQACKGTLDIRGRLHRSGRPGRAGDTRTESGPDITVLCELRARLLCSAWNSRCWTFQEAVLGRSFYVDTADHLSLPLPYEGIFGEAWTHEAGRRWIRWRQRSQRRQLFLAYGRLFAAAVPLSDSYLIGFKILCGPQAWKKCRRATTTGIGRSNSRYMFRLLIGIVWLIGAAFGALLTLPCILMLTVALWLSVVIFATVLAMNHFARQDGVLPTQNTLGQEFALQLAADVVAELPSTRISTALEVKQPETAAYLRARQLAETWNAMTWRSTTRIEDVHSILANLTDAAAFEILDFQGAAQRMRALVSNYRLLPLGFLFDSTDSRDPENRWLPVAPSEDRIAYAATLWTMQVGLESIRISLSELSSQIVAFACTEVERGAHPLELHDPIRKLVFVLAAGATSQGSHRDSLGVYLFELPDAGFRIGQQCSVRGARLVVRSQIGGKVYGVYDAPVRAKAIRVEVKPPTRANPRLLPSDTVLHIPIREHALNCCGARSPSANVNTQDNWNKIMASSVDQSMLMRTPFS